MAAIHPADPNVVPPPADETQASPRRRWMSWAILRELLPNVAFSIAGTAVIVVINTIIVQVFPTAGGKPNNALFSLLLIAVTMAIIAITIGLLIVVSYQVRKAQHRIDKVRLKLTEADLYLAINRDVTEALRVRNTA